VQRRCSAAYVGAIIVVDADIVQVLVREQPGLKVELRGEDEGLLHTAGVHAVQDVLGALSGLRTREVGVGVQDTLLQVVDHGSYRVGSIAVGHGLSSVVGSWTLQPLFR
jgi:hypothetical protein